LIADCDRVEELLGAVDQFFLGDRFCFSTSGGNDGEKKCDGNAT